MREEALRGLEDGPPRVRTEMGANVGCVQVPWLTVGCSSVLAVLGAAATLLAHGPWWLLAAFALLFAFGFGGLPRFLVYAAATAWIGYRTWGSWWFAIPVALVLVALLTGNRLFRPRLRVVG